MGCSGCQRRRQKLHALAREFLPNPFNPTSAKASARLTDPQKRAELDNRIQFLEGNRLLLGKDVPFVVRMRLIDQYGGTYTIIDGE